MLQLRQDKASKVKLPRVSIKRVTLGSESAVPSFFVCNKLKAGRILLSGSEQEAWNLLIETMKTEALIELLAQNEMWLVLCFFLLHLVASHEIISTLCDFLLCSASSASPACKVYLSYFEVNSHSTWSLPNKSLTRTNRTSHDHLQCQGC